MPSFNPEKFVLGKLCRYGKHDYEGTGQSLRRIHVSGKQKGKPGACVECEKARYVENSEQISANAKAWYQANKEKLREREKAWRLANPEMARERDQAWRLANPEKYQELQRNYYQQNCSTVRA